MCGVSWPSTVRRSRRCRPGPAPWSSTVMSPSTASSAMPSQLAALIAGSSIALAPYRATADNFTRFADPSKVKGYLAAGLPTLVTDVPPNARELERCGGAKVIDDDPRALADE